MLRSGQNTNIYTNRISWYAGFTGLIKRSRRYEKHWGAEFHVLFQKKRMPEFKQFPKGDVKPTGWFYLSGIVSAFFILIGFEGIISKEIEMKSKHILIQGDEAVFIGYIFLIFGLFSLYHLLFKTKKIEENQPNFHELQEFEEIVNNYNTKFEFVHTATPRSNNSALIGFAYKLSLTFNKPIGLNLSIKQRDSLELFLWKIGITRKFDILTGSNDFDSRYRVKSTNPDLFLKIFTKDTLELLENFDKDYPPIRTKNGILHITDSKIEYIEGPYSEENRLFDPHRGVIENLFYQLEKIAVSIESTVPEKIEWKNENHQLSTIDKIEIVSKAAKPFVESFTRGYIVFLYIALSLILLIGFFFN